LNEYFLFKTFIFQYIAGLLINNASKYQQLKVIFEKVRKFKRCKKITLPITVF